jgi:tetratricopeptide (TPR) repeat protein
MRHTVLILALAGLALAQQPPKQPAPKSQKELDAILAIQNAQDPDARIKAAEELITKFKDTEFKEFALQMETLSYQQKNDFENLVIAGERTLEVNPDNVVVLIALATAIPQRTREHDLDKEEKLNKADQYADKALKLVPNLAKFNPAISDEDWTNYKKSAMSQAHEALGMSAFTRKNFAKAEASFKAAAEVSPQPEPTIFYRLGMTYAAQNKHDDAIGAFDKAIAAGGVKVGGRDLAAEQKAAVQKARQAAGGGADKPAPPVEIKKQ